jgi:hypothetical protein
MASAPLLRALAPSVLLLLTPAVAFAQEGEAETELGLDLTADTVDLRPTLAVVGIGVPEDMARERALQEWINGTLASVAQKTLLFSVVLKPEDVAARLEGRHDQARQCAQDACMAEIASALGVERVFTAQLSRDAQRTALRMNAFSRATMQVATATVEGSGPPRADFLKKAVQDQKPLLQSLAGKLAQLKIVPSVPEAAVVLGDRDLGQGTVDVKVSAGTYALKVEAEGHQVHQQQLTLEEGKTTELAVALEKLQLKKVAAAGPSAKPPGGPFALPAPLTHPGTYLGAAGAVAVAVGVGLGVSAMGASQRAIDTDRDGILNITRTEAQAARSSAMMANVLLAGGVLALSGGGAWLMLQPPGSGGAGVAAGGKF